MDPKELVELYIDKGMTTPEIAAIYSIAPSTVRKHLKRLGVQMRTQSDYMKLDGRFRQTRTNSATLFKVGHKTPVAIKQKISRTLKARKIQPSPEAIAKRARLCRKYTITPELAREIKGLYNDKLTIYQIAQSKGLSATSVYQSLLSQGVKCRTASERARALWSDFEWKERQVALTRQGAFKRPTKPEQRLIEIIAKHSLPYRYTGDGSFIIGGLNPDFVEVNGRKLAVDIFGDYWHGEKADSYIDTEEGRAARLREYGWKLIVIWENEIKTLPEETIIAKLNTHKERR